jgi:methionyl-tRNA formyltransferase
MDFIFIGGTFRGFKLLEKLLEHNYVPKYIVVLKEDDHEIEKHSDSLITLANKRGIRYVCKKKLGQEDFEVINSRLYDFAIVCGWRTIIPLELNKQFKIGMLAAHDSLLPKYRGFAPLNWAIINGESQTGVTLFKINGDETDSGDILQQATVKIGSSEYASEVYTRIIEATIKVYFDFFEDFKNKSVVSKKQNENEATYTCKRGPNDGRIDWSKNSHEIFNLVRALAHPYPGAFCFFDKRIFHIRKASLGKNNEKMYSGKILGRVITVASDHIEVLCNQGTISIYEWEDKSTNVIEIPSKTVKSITATLE